MQKNCIIIFSLVLTQSYSWLQYSVAYDFCLDISVVFYHFEIVQP